jgi:hypothetical protein
MRTITMIRRLSLALGLYALISSSVAQRLDWLGPIEVRGVTNSGLVIGKAADNSGAVRTVRVHRRLGSELGGTLGGNHSEAWGITGNGLARWSASARCPTAARRAAHATLAMCCSRSARRARASRAMRTSTGTTSWTTPTC